jgi:hypothetical protein
VALPGGGTCDAPTPRTLVLVHTTVIVVAAWHDAVDVEGGYAVERAIDSV